MSLPSLPPHPQPSADGEAQRCIGIQCEVAPSFSSPSRSAGGPLFCPWKHDSLDVVEDLACVVDFLGGNVVAEFIAELCWAGPPALGAQGLAKKLARGGGRRLLCGVSRGMERV
jgi:hypothetical protein